MSIKNFTTAQVAASVYRVLNQECTALRASSYWNLDDKGAGTQDMRIALDYGWHSGKYQTFSKFDLSDVRTIGSRLESTLDAITCVVGAVRLHGDVVRHIIHEVVVTEQMGTYYDGQLVADAMVEYHKGNQPMPKRSPEYTPPAVPNQAQGQPTKVQMFHQQYSNPPAQPMAVEPGAYSAVLQEIKNLCTEALNKEACEFYQTISCRNIQAIDKLLKDI